MDSQNSARPVTVRQHYVAACYLAGFTQGGRRDSTFFVHPMNGSAVRVGKPENVAFENDYNSIEVEGFRKDHLEDVFSKRFEGPACNLFRVLSANPGRPFATEEELVTALSFLAFQAARVPISKEKYETLIAQSGREFLQKMAYSPEFRQDVVNTAGTALDEEGKKGMSPEALQILVNSGEERTVADKSALAIGILRLTIALIGEIASMRTTLWYADSPDWFVCSDHPVSLFYSITGNIFEDPLALENPSIRLLTDGIYMPIARNVALVLHRFPNVPLVQRALREMVGIVNILTLSQARQGVFSSTPNFVCNLQGGIVGNGQEGIAEIGRLRNLH